MLKKVAIVVGLATAGALALTPLAFADDDCQYGGGNSGEGSYLHQDPSELGNNSSHEGVFGFFDSGQSHSADHDADCDQDNSSDIE